MSENMYKPLETMAVSLAQMMITGAEVYQANDKVVNDLNSIFEERDNPVTGKKEFYLRPTGGCK